MTFEEFLDKWEVASVENLTLTFDDVENGISLMVVGDPENAQMKLSRINGIEKEPIENIALRCCASHLLMDTQEKAFDYYCAAISKGKPNPKSPWAREYH